jgi:hypothetical protein
MTIAAFLLVVAGMLIITMALLGRPSFDFAIAVTSGWHVTVFPPPMLAGVLAIVLGVAMFVAARPWR